MEPNPDFDRKVICLLAMVRECAPEARKQYLSDACGEDADLLHEVAETLAWEERMGSFLHRPLLQSMEFARPFNPGDVVADRFNIVRVIGEGGMGVVYEAFDRRRRQRIAIKAAKPGFQRLLSPELEGALKVRHPNICLVNEIHTAKSDYAEIEFLTMEFLEGETLATHLAKHGKFAPSEAIDIARQLSAGLAEAHRCGIIHRDLKTANIILCRTENGGKRAVITDFGLAGGGTDAGVIAGTPGYMAPEVLSEGVTSTASDIYALGVILHEVAAGCRPPDSELIEGDLSARSNRSSRVDESLESRWARTIGRCLDPSPDARPAAASDVIEELDTTLLRKETVVPAALAASLLLAIAALQPQVHEWLINNLWPFGSRVTVIVLPVDGDADDTYSSLLDDVSRRIAKLSFDGRRVAVIPADEARRDQTQNAQQADEATDATHALTTSIRRDGGDLVVDASVVNLDKQVNVGRLSARYSDLSLPALSVALTGTVSYALRLEGPPVSDAVSTAAAQSYEQGLKVLRNEEGGHVMAISLLETAARKDPTSPLPLAALVEAHIEAFRAGKKEALDDARSALSAAESLNPDAAAVRYAAGLVQEQSINLVQARANFERVIEIDPNNAYAYVHLGRTFRDLRMPDDALDAYLQAIGLAPDSFFPYHSLGVFYYGRGQASEAAKQFQKAIERAPGRAEGYKNLAAAFSDLGEYQEAEAALVKSLAIRESASACNSLGAIRAYQGRSLEAVEHYRRAVHLDAGTYVYRLNLGDAARRLGLHEESQSAYQEGMELALDDLRQNPGRGSVRGHAAYFAARLGETAIAVRDIEQAIGFSPDDAQVKLIAVLTYEALNRRSDALEIFQRARDELRAEIERHPDLADFSRDARSRGLLH